MLVPGLWAQAQLFAQAPVPTPLSRILQCADRISGSPARAWEDVLAEALGFTQAPAPTLAAQQHRWLALPVTLTPGLTDLVAQPVADLTAAECEDLLAAVAEDLQMAAATLRPLPTGGFELSLVAEEFWPGRAPSFGLGRPMHAPQLSSPLVKQLQVLMNVVQMQWSTHPVNQARQERGAATVNGLWLWSPGVWPVVHNERRVVVGGGTVGAWLSKGTGVDWRPEGADANADLMVFERFLSPLSESGFTLALEELTAMLLSMRLHSPGVKKQSIIIVQDPGVVCLRYTPWHRWRVWRRFGSVWM